MKKIYPNKVLLIVVLVISSASFTMAQCPAGASTAIVNWDQLDYLPQTGSYSGFVSNAQMQTQGFTFGRNRLSINFPMATITTNGENATNTAEAGSLGAGADVEYNGNGTITITFDTILSNLEFSLYDFDNLQSVRVRAEDGLGMPLDIDMKFISAGVLTIVGDGTPLPLATANNTALLNNDVRGTLNIRISGNSPVAGRGVKRVFLDMGVSAGVPGNFWLSDLTACIYGSFPLDYYISQKPWNGQPAYYLVTPDNNGVYLFNPLTGVADWLFSEPASPWVNSMAYDHVNRILYYVMDHSSPVSTNRSLKKYDFNTETISTVVPDLRTLGIPLFDIVVESAGAAFYNGSLFLGIEGTNGAKNSNRESIIWRIDFDAALTPIRASQVFARPSDNGTGTLTHDWGDFSIKNGTLYDFNTGNVGSTSQFVHFNMQSGNATFYPTGGNPAPIQVGQTWDGTLYWTGGQSPELGRVALYNEDGTIGAKRSATVTVCSPSWVGRAGDASDPFRPKSDFGDAPASYDPVADDKATHEYDCNLRLGPTFDREWDKTSSPTATADGTDEDGITTVTVLSSGGVFNHVQSVRVFNNTGSPATLVGWLDYDADGVYEPGEGRSLNIPTNAAMQTVNLAWVGIPVTLPTGSITFIRIRVTSAANGMTVNNSTHWYANGEVEDYRVFVSAVLPIELLSFTAEAENNSKVKLKWSTGEEVNFNGFEIERSQDGIDWQVHSFVTSYSNGQKINNYSLIDQSPLIGLSYYRLKLVGLDGDVKYSPVRTVSIEAKSGHLQISPNPVQRQANIQFNHNKNEIGMLRIVDGNGKTVKYMQVALQSGVNKITMQDCNRFAPGIYVMELIAGSKTMNAKFIVQAK